MTILGLARARSRGGLASIAVLVCLLVLIMMSGVVLRQRLTGRERVKGEARRLQAEWLAEAGIRRALARLGADPKYPGETWKIPAAEVGRTAKGSADAVVTIVVEASKDKATAREIRVQVDDTQDPQTRSRHSRRIAIDIKTSGTEPKPRGAGE